MISIVIPLYNKEKQIANTLQTVLAQTYQEFEIIIVNDGSTDNSVEEVLKIKDSRIRLFQQSNEGVSAARNRGIKESKFNYIALLDADDEWKTDYLATQMDLIYRYPECSVYACAYEFKDSKGKISPLILNKISFKREDGVLNNYFEVASCSHPPISSSTVVFSKKAFVLIGGFPVGITSGEDLLTWAKLAVDFQIAYSTKPSAFFVQHDSHLVSNKPTRLHDETNYVARELISLCKKTTGKQKKHLKLYISMWYKMRASVFLRINYKRQTFKYSFYSLKYNPFNLKVYIFMCLVLLPVTLQNYIKNLYTT